MLVGVKANGDRLLQIPIDSRDGRRPVLTLEPVSEFLSSLVVRQTLLYGRGDAKGNVTQCHVVSLYPGCPTLREGR